MNVLPELALITASESATGTLGIKLSFRSKRTTRPLIVAKPPWRPIRENWDASVIGIRFWLISPGLFVSLTIRSIRQMSVFVCCATLSTLIRSGVSKGVST